MTRNIILVTATAKENVSPESWAQLSTYYPGKNESFLLSRQALKEHVQKCYNIPVQTKLELNEFQFIRETPSIRYSITHTRNLSFVSSCPKVLSTGIGIDCEAKERTMKPGAEKYFEHAGDQHRFSKLEAWCLKEAGFKAYSNAGHDIKLLKEIQLTSTQMQFEDQIASFQFLPNQRHFVVLAKVGGAVEFEVQMK